MDFASIITNLLLIFAIGFLVIIVTYEVLEAWKYSYEKKEYGKIEGHIIDKNFKVLSRPGIVPKYEYYFIIEKEENHKILSRKIYVKKEDYDNFKVGEYLKENAVSDK